MKDALICLHDILTEIQFLHTVRDRSTFEQFKANSADIRAASYSILVISEAVRRLPDAWLTPHPHVPWHAIRAIGNKLRYEYQRVSDVILWGVITVHSDVLKEAIADLLKQQGS